MVKMMEYKKMEHKKMEAKADEDKLKTEAGFVTDISTAGTLMTTICTDLGTAPPVRKSSYIAKQLKDAKRNINRMKGQKQGT